MNLFSAIRDLFKKGADFKEIEKRFLLADFDVELTKKVIELLKGTKIDEVDEKVSTVLGQVLVTQELHLDPAFMTLFLVVGVNGVGKTTIISKVAQHYKKKGFKVLLAAADTFRAAAIEQIEHWATVTGIDIVKHQPGADPGAVVFDSIDKGVANGTQLLIIDTAGRLQNKDELMQQLQKMNKIIDRKKQQYPGKIFQYNILVIDANLGKNSFQQAEIFKKLCHIDAFAVTKLDSTAKGGAIFSIADVLRIPLVFASYGEKIENFTVSEDSTFKRFIIDKI